MKKKKEAKEAGWQLLTGPCERTKNPSAGVGAMARKEVTLVNTERKTEEFERAWAKGRAEKYEVDVGWAANLRVCVLYGKTGDSREAKLETEHILEAIKEEDKASHYLPTVILGDFNEDPDRIATVQELTEEQQWVDIGTPIQYMTS